MFQQGSIRRIQVKQFVTYSYAEFYPGPHLNMIIGPNGTGKSTMVAAIILGLGGNPKTVGRGTKISEYIKHGCNEATIDIYLQGNDHNTFLKVTRNFDSSERNLWLINNTRKSLKEVLETIKAYNIQVDNLCQFLPQDRVQDFAKMDKQELLKATQLALCREDLFEKQQKLIDFKNQYTEMNISLEKNEQKLVQAKESNARLEVKVKSFNKKRNYLESIQHIERKVAWIRYEQLLEEVNEIKKDKVKATEIFDKHKKIGKPMEEEINNAKKNAKQLHNSHSNTMKIKWDMEKTLEEKYEKRDFYKQSIHSVNQEMNVRLDEFVQRDAEIDLTVNKIEELENIKKKLMEKCKNDQQVNQKLGQITAEIEQVSSQQRILEDKRDNLMSHRVNKQAELRMMENELSHLENVKNQRLQKLYQIDKRVHQAVLWLRNNKHLFKGEVCEPMMLEINVLDIKDAIFLENIISKRDRLAFTCERKDDMNLLVHSLRNQQKLPVNVLHSNSNIDMEKFQPSTPIEQLRKFGFHAYVDHLLTAPRLIMNYLYRSYGIHNIPVGDAKVDQYFEQLPNSIRLFFSQKSRYSVKFSAYTGAKSTRQSQISPNNSLSISVDIMKLENLRGQIQEKKESFSLTDMELKNYDNQLQQCREKIEELQSEKKVIYDLKQQIKTVGSRYMAMKAKVENLKAANSNRESVKTDAKQKIRKIIEEMVLYQNEVCSTFKGYKKLLVKSQLSMMKVESARKKCMYLENKYHETKRLCDEAEEVLNTVKEKYADIVGQAKAALQKAKQLSKGFTPDDEGFNEFKEIYEKLPDDLKVLQVEKDQILLKIDCLRTADDGELEF
ncbi:structural maintenance of chromosomes protein 5 isoform X2 [Coccinella septempunctata]|uniref:structural maintenance of chromosomes protein 5 isoform X2 n=1 Tax=Coccinella septempunctata TaxID=41139 RepID=UPI001D076612|nr:structural maintenance of chromosomes protein 5 isoform X2 [Coccinella septempunctata]